MTVRVYTAGEDVYLTGAGQTPCLRWHRDGERWLSEPADLPEEAIYLHRQANLEDVFLRLTGRQLREP